LIVRKLRYRFTEPGNPNKNPGNPNKKKIWTNTGNPNKKKKLDKSGKSK
jgi:hypothetical protein